MYKITKELAYEMLDFGAEARFTFKLILKQFKSKIYGQLDRSILSDANKQKIKRGMRELKKKDILISISKGYYLLNPDMALSGEEDLFLKSLWFFKKDYLVNYPPINIEDPSDDILSDVNILMSNISGYKSYLKYFEFYYYLIDNDEELIDEGLNPEFRYFYFGNSLKSARADISSLLDELRKMLTELTDIEKSYEIYQNSNLDGFDLEELLQKDFISKRIYNYCDCEKHCHYLI